MNGILSPARWVGREARMIVAELRAKSSPEPAIDDVCAAPPGQGRPVLLVPGLLSGDHSLAFLARWLARWGYRPITSGITRNDHCPDALIDALSARLSANLAPNERALLVGHSKGGLLSFGIAHRHPELIERVLALGSPLGNPFGLQWNTTVTVRAIAAAKRMRRTGRPGCYTSRCSCEAMRLVTDQLPPPVPVANVASRRDGIVKYESCIRPHVTTHEVGSRHNSMPWEPEVIAVVARWLEDGLGAGPKPVPTAASPA